MEANLSNYIRFCKTVNTKGTLVPIESQTAIEEEIKKSPNSDFYTSLFTFDDSAKDYFEKNGSIKGFKGKAVTTKAVFDFDYEKNPSVAQKETVELLRRFDTLGIDVSSSVNVFFSGNKGFHVELSTAHEFEPKELKQLCLNIAKGLTTLDEVIYNTTRLYRLYGTKHPKSKLYKIELDPNDLLNKSFEEIKEQAKSKPTTEIYKTTPIQDSTLNAIIRSFIEEPKKEAQSKAVVVDDYGDDEVRGINDIDYTLCPKSVPRCIHALSKGVMKPGERNAAFLRLAAYYKNQGMDKEVAFSTLKGVSRLNARLYPDYDAVGKDEIWNTVVSSVFDSEDWKQIAGATGTDAKNELLKKYCDCIKSSHRCILHGEKEGFKSAIQVDEIYDSFKDFAENFDKNTVKTGIGLIDDYMNIAVGTTTLLVGACGSGKTTVALNIMENMNKNGLHTMFFSLDMHKNLVYLKLAQKLTNYSQQEINYFFKTKNREKQEEIRQVINKAYGKTMFDFSSTLTMDQMRDKVRQAEAKLGEKIKLVVVDYASRVTGPYSDAYANARFNALKSTEVADATDSAWIFLSQISRNTGSGSSPLRTKRAAKESGDWEEAASNVITVWRPFMGVEGKDDVMRMFLAKNRMGQELERPLWWNGAKGMVKDMSDIELETYEEDRLPEEKELAKKGFQR